MTTVPEKTAETFGVLTDDAFARSRLRLGVPRPQQNKPHNYEVTWDGVRHFAYGYGDDNPLYCDPGYAAGTRWGRLVAPPTFLYTMGEDAAPEARRGDEGPAQGRSLRRAGFLPGGDGVRVVATAAAR